MDVHATPAYQQHRPALTGVVLAAGAGRRLLPLSTLLPKALCPVGNRALVDLALDRLAPLVDDLIVNAHHDVDLVVEHLDRMWSGRVAVSIEPDIALGTAGGIAHMRHLINGRDVVVVNADAWSHDSLAPLVDGWDGETVRVMVNGTGGFGSTAQIVASTLPWSVVERLVDQPTGLYEAVWRHASASGELEVIAHEGAFIDCGTPLDYLRANLAAVDVHRGSIVADDAMVEAGATISQSVIGAGARIGGTVIDSVVWPGQAVEPGERLIRSIRAGTSVTVGPL
ncbi:MAG: sugar phosphate nucleotidyltransferase [Actinomycetes bacterium]